MITTSTTNLPTYYHEIASVDLSKDRKLMLKLNIIGCILFVLFATFFLFMASMLNTYMSNFSFNIKLGPSNFWLILLPFFGVVFVSVLVVLIHEGVHGFFFWFFTHSQPKYGFKGLYAYASAPGWYIPRSQYIIIGLAPLLLLSFLGILLMPLMPLSAIFWLVLALTLNASGAVGDLYIVFWLLRMRSDILITDIGDKMVVYAPKEASFYS